MMENSATSTRGASLFFFIKRLILEIKPLIIVKKELNSKETKKRDSITCNKSICESQINPIFTLSVRFSTILVLLYSFKNRNFLIFK